MNDSWKPVILLTSATVVMTPIAVFLAAWLILGCDYRCDDCVRGACVLLESDVPLDTKALAHGLSVVDSRIPGTDLELLARTIGLEIAWTDDASARGSTIWMDEDGDNFSTREDYRRIELLPSTSCIEQAYVAGHEMLHIYSIHVLGTDPQDNHDHRVPGVFSGAGNLESGLRIQIMESMPVGMGCVYP